MQIEIYKKTYNKFTALSTGSPNSRAPPSVSITTSSPLFLFAPHLTHIHTIADVIPYILSVYARPSCVVMIFRILIPPIESLRTVQYFRKKVTFLQSHNTSFRPPIISNAGSIQMSFSVVRNQYEHKFARKIKIRFIS